MENDGNYFNLPDTITFKYQALENKLQPPPNIYNGSGPCLHRSVGKKFDRVLNCVQVCGVLWIPFFKHLTASLNQYAQLILSTNGKWKISLTEMVRFHGVMLNLSIDNKNLWGYETYLGIGWRLILIMIILLTFMIIQFGQQRSSLSTDSSRYATSAISWGFAIKTATIAAKAYFMIEPQF